MRSRPCSYGLSSATLPVSRYERSPISELSRTISAWCIREIVSKLLTTSSCSCAAELEWLIVSKAPTPASTAIVRPTTMPVARAVRCWLAICHIAFRHGKHDGHAGAAAVARFDTRFSAQLQRQSTDQRQAKAAAQ